MTACPHTVTVHGIQEPCGREAVAVRLDPTERTPYPVCFGHVRSPMQSLAVHDRETAARAWDKAVRAMRYEDGTPVELVANVNPYREAADRD